MIPRVFHRIWLGPDPMPDAFQRYGDTWTKLHPSWEMRLWTEENLPSVSPELLATCREYRHKSNIYRYYLLRDQGGVYIDTDFECRKNIEPLIEGCDFVTAAQLADLVAPGALAPGFFGCKRLNNTAWSLVLNMPRHYAMSSKTDPNRSHFGPLYFSEVVRRAIDKTTRILPRALFYPYSWDELERRHELFPDAYAVHHWASRTTEQPLARGLRPSW